MSELEGAYWVFGIFSAITASLFEALGENLVKLGYTQVYSKGHGDWRRVFCNATWIAGIFCICFLNVSFTLISYALADASLVVPFTGMHIVFNIVFSRVINKEAFTMLSLGFTGVILIGVTIVSATANHSTSTYTTSELEAFFKAEPFVIASIVLLIFMLVLGLLGTLPRSVKLRCVALGMLCGAVAVCTQLWAKILAQLFDELISEDFNSATFKASPLPYAAPFVCLAFGFAELVLLNIVLKGYDAFIIAPIVGSTIIVVGSIYLGVFFQEYKSWPLHSKILVPIGTVVTAIGVLLLVWSHTMFRHLQDKQIGHAIEISPVDGRQDKLLGGGEKGDVEGAMLNSDGKSVVLT